MPGTREGGFDGIEQDESARQRKREIDIAALEVEHGRRLSQSERHVHESEATDDEDEYRECGYARGDDELEDAVSGEKLDGQVRALSETVARSEKTEPHETESSELFGERAGTVQKVAGRNLPQHREDHCGHEHRESALEGTIDVRFQVSECHSPFLISRISRMSSSISGSSRYRS